MVHDSHGLHHLQKRIHTKHERYPHPVKWKRTLDKIVIAAGIIGPIMTVPQIWKIWVIKNATGVSAISWFTYMLCSIVWLIYGYAHKERPIIITYSIWVFFDILIVVGTLLYG